MKQIFCADVNDFATDFFEGLQGYVVVVEHVKFPSCSVPLAQNNTKRNEPLAISSFFFSILLMSTDPGTVLFTKWLRAQLNNAVRQGLGKLSYASKMPSCTAWNISFVFGSIGSTSWLVGINKIKRNLGIKQFRCENGFMLTF